MSAGDLSELSMLDLFRIDADSQVQALTGGLLALERDPRAAEHLESCMRAAHSIKGAARIVGIAAGVDVAHVMEDCFVAAQQGRIVLCQSRIDQLLQGVDLLKRISGAAESDIPQWTADRQDVQDFMAALSRAVAEGGELGAAEQDAMLAPATVPSAPAAPGQQASRHLRVTSEDLTRLLGLAGESLVESRWVEPYVRSLQRLKRLHYDLADTLNQLRESLPEAMLDQRARDALLTAQQRSLECRQVLSQRVVELDTFDRRVANLAHRLYGAALACRMRPFADGVGGLPRMVRDLARSLNKQARLEIVGGDTQVDRDILERLETPLVHLVRNALDHALELPQDRIARGKPAEGVVRLEAHHSAGRLQVSVSDDGRGIDLTALRNVVVARKLTNAETATRLSQAELLEFLFLPGFTMASAVTEISGRGVGLDIVQNMLKQVRGNVSVLTEPGKGTRFQLQLPLTLSVVRALLVECGGEPYAIPLANVARTLKLERDSVATVEGRRHFELNGRRIGLVDAHQVFDLPLPAADPASLPVVVLGEGDRTYGLVVDRLLAQRELVVQPLDARLGKVKDVAAGALMDDGTPVLILDVEDVVRSVEKLAAAGGLSATRRTVAAAADAKRKRVLVIDDSLTVRELERKLLAASGYEVEVAVDGMDGWNAVRSGRFDLVITDIDMPRMDGIELVKLLRNDANVKALPVMIVSYKDRAEDRRRGLDAGADYYLGKGSFHDDTLLQAVVDLIGKAAV